VFIKEAEKGDHGEQDGRPHVSLSGIGLPRPLFRVIRRCVPTRIRPPLRALWRKGLFPRSSRLVQIMGQIEGWLTDSEAIALYRTLRACQAPVVAVEIGSWYGKSSVMIAGGIRDAGGGILYALDPFEGADGCSALNVGPQRATGYLDRFQQNINAAGLTEIVRPVRGYSYHVVKSWTTPIDLLFIDGDHEYGAVKRDFEDWSPHLRWGGIIIFHDTNGDWPGPTRLAKEEIRPPNWEKVRCVDSMTIARKAASISAKPMSAPSH